MKNHDARYYFDDLAEQQARLAHEARNDAAVALSPLVTAAIRRAVEAYTERATTPRSRVSA